MNVSRIAVRNFRSWESAELDIESGVSLISGSNGAGKSSLLEAVDVALFGCSSDAGRYIRRGTDEARVQVDVETQDGPLTIERSIRRSGSTVRVGLKVWGAEVELTAATVTETQAALDVALGVTREVLHASAFSFQHSGSAFTEAAPRDRKRIFAAILELGMWDALHEDAKLEARDAKQRAQIAQALVEQHDGAACRLADAQARHQMALDGDMEATRQEVIAEQESARLAAESEAAREARRQHAAAVEAAERARADHERAAAARAKAEEALERARAAAANAPDIAQAQADGACAHMQLEDSEAAYRTASEAHMRWNERYSRVAGELRDLNAEQMTGDCARCGQPLAEPVEPKLAPLRADYEQLLATRAEPDDTPVLAAHARVQAAATALAEAETIELLAGSIDALEEAARDATTQVSYTHENIRLMDKAVEDWTPVETDVEERHATAIRAVDVARVMHRDAATALATAEAEAAQAELDANAEADARKRLAAAQHDAAIADILAQGFGPNGVPALVIDNVLGQLADEANRVLAELGTPIRVDLRSQRVTQAGKLIDALDIIVLDGVDEAPYETLSGGERTRVALALRAALTRLLAAKSGARVRLLVIDEPSGLDASGAEAFADVLQAFITARIFDTALIVTHDERLADRIDRVIRVTKTPGGSSRLAENSTGPASPSIPSAGPVELQEVTDA